MYKTETVSGIIKYVGCARIDGDDNFSIVLEEVCFILGLDSTKK
jgi:hypothetical protein